MKESPILFSGPMVRAILDGRKTQTRRVIKDVSADCELFINAGDGFWQQCYRDDSGAIHSKSWLTKFPYGAPGDRLWVKETWQYFDWTEDGEPFIRYAADNHCTLKHVNSDEWGEKIWDIFCDLSKPENFNIDRRASDRRWRPSIHMPRWASRITMRITDIRVERLQKIDGTGAMAEGCPDKYVDGAESASVDALSTEWFADLWQSINGNRPGCSWDDNPWVWVICFERVTT